MIMQVHDEIVFEVAEDKAEEYAKMILEEMESIADLTVPLSADYNISYTWGDN